MTSTDPAKMVVGLNGRIDNGEGCGSWKSEHWTGCMMRPEAASVKTPVLLSKFSDPLGGKVT